MSDDEYEIGIILLCPDCGEPVEVIVFADMGYEFQCPICDEPVEIPDPETAGFH